MTNPYSLSALQELVEKLAKAAEIEKDITDTNARLNNHITDLESRKRAPLYQKKQEEELRAVTEKAQEAELRAQEAELKFKEAKACFTDRLHSCFIILACALPKTFSTCNEHSVQILTKRSPRRLLFLLQPCLYIE